MEPVFIVLLIAVLSLGLVVGFMAAAAMAEEKIDWESRWLDGFNAGATARDNTVLYHDNPYEIEDDAEHDGWKCGWRYWEYILHGDKSAEYAGEPLPRGNGVFKPGDVVVNDTINTYNPSCCSSMLQACGALDEEPSEDSPTILSMGLPGVAKTERCQDVPSDSSPVIFDEIQENSVVMILADDPKRGLSRGSVGVVHYVYEDGDHCLVEVTLDNGVQDTITLKTSELEALCEHR